MKRIHKLLINITIIVSILFGYYYFYGYYFSKDQCILETKRSLYVYEEQKIDEIEFNNYYFTLFADLDKKTYSIVGTKKIGFLYHTSSCFTGQKIREEDSSIDINGGYNNEFGMNVVVYRNDKNVHKVEIEFEDGQKLILDEWSNDFAFTLVEGDSFLNGTYKTYDKNNNFIEEIYY